MASGYKTLSSKIIYKNPFFTVYEDFYKKPDGTTHKYYFLKKNPFVAIIPLASENEIYLVRQFRYTIQNFTWEIPEGFVEDGETPLMAAKRELAEETGFQAKLWKDLGYTYLGVGHTNQRFLIFIATGLSKIPKNIKDSEIDRVKKFSLTKIKQMIIENELVESATIVSLYKYDLNSRRKS